jgi:hypothetical protein
VRGFIKIFKQQSGFSLSYVIGENVFSLHRQILARSRIMCVKFIDLCGQKCAYGQSTQIKFVVVTYKVTGRLSEIKEMLRSLSIKSLIIIIVVVSRVSKRNEMKQTKINRILIVRVKFCESVKVR